MPLAHDPTQLPDDLPVPVDDGAADHLVGALVPDLSLPATSGGAFDLRGLGRAVVFAYPRTGRPGVEPLTGWDEIPGARGCTPEACSFRDLSAEFEHLGAQVVGLSTQDPDDQLEAATRLQLPYRLLSDADLGLTTAMRLPTFEVDGVTLLRRLTMLVRAGVVEQVLYPVLPPDRAAADALAALRSTPGG